MNPTITTLFTIVEAVWLFSLLVTIWFYTRPINLVGRPSDGHAARGPLPKIIMLYPVLHELEETMRTTFHGMSKAPYPADKLRVIAIPNDNDHETVAALNRLQTEFGFLEVLAVPPTTDSSWDAVWTSWELTPDAYWWHHGKRAKSTDLPPKKTRQLVWAMYQLAPGNEDALLSYIDADSVVPEDYWQTAAIGMESYDVVQNTNITGNLLSSLPASFFGQDHISWDSSLYRHLSADGKQPFWVLGKGVFYRMRQLLDHGGFHPWLTIEDPEVGMRLWANGAKLGIVESPLIEEVPATWRQGVLQRKRWVAGFFQSLGSPLVQMGMSPMQRIRARLNFVPCFSLAINPLGYVVAIWTIVEVFRSPTRVLPLFDIVLSTVTVVLAVGVIGYSWSQSWRMTAPVLATHRQRWTFFLRVNPIAQLVYWLWWILPLAKGTWMFIRDTGLTWERTEKRDANHALIRTERSDAASEAALDADGARENALR